MIHQLLNITRPLIIFDTETTGVDVKNDRIVELGFQLWTPEGLQKEYRTLVNPGVPIPSEVTEIHGIKDDDFRLCRTCGEHLVPICCPAPRRWPTFKEIAPNISTGFSNCDFAGKNVRFDLKILTSEMARCGQSWSYAGARIVDIDRLEAWLNKRSLSHLYRKYVREICPNCGGRGSLHGTPDVPCERCLGIRTIGKKLKGAHGALTDVQASTTVIEAQMQQLTANEDEAIPLPRDLDALHALQWPGWIDSEGLFQFVNGVPCFGRWGKHAGKSMASVEISYYDFILKNDFSAEVKAIAGRAKMKQFP